MPTIGGARSQEYIFCFFYVLELTRLLIPHNSVLLVIQNHYDILIPDRPSNGYLILLTGLESCIFYFWNISKSRALCGARHGRASGLTRPA